MIILEPGARKEPVRCWQPLEIELTAQSVPENPYTETEVWADLSGPGFSKRVAGFWDGGRTYRIRVAATAPGTWRWSAGSEPTSLEVSGMSGSFVAHEWSGEELRDVPTRRGMVGASADGRGLEYADGTPFFLLGDTWWATPTHRYPWDPEARDAIPAGSCAGASPNRDAPGPTVEDMMPRAGMSFQEMVTYRKAQGYNCIAMLSGFPHWANDGSPATIVDDEGLSIRNAWVQPGTESAKDMHNEGGRPFEFPGHVPGFEDVVPDLDRINPAYFEELDRKIEYLNEAGFVPFVETARRDVSQVWKRYHRWPDSYARYISYLFARLQAFNCILSPIHFDWPAHSIPSRDFNDAAHMVIDRYGPPPFGTLLSANSSPSTLANFGSADEARWVTLHQTGNWREHDHYWYATEIFHSTPARPSISGEPYYPGFPDDDPPAPSDEATRNCRSGMYGGFLSGNFAGYIYGAQGMWGGDIEPEARYRTWEALAFESGDQVRHLRSFAEVRGLEYRELEPLSELVTPNKTGPVIGYRNWAYAAANRDRSVVLAYFEAGCPQVTMRSLKYDTAYRLRWFDPREGSWEDPGEACEVRTDQFSRARIPEKPTEDDWGCILEEAT